MGKTHGVLFFLLFDCHIYIDIPRILSNADLHKEYLILNNIFS